MDVAMSGLVSSYGQYFFGGKPNDNRSFVDANISVSFAAGADDNSLKILIEPVVTADYDAKDFSVRINSRFLWNRSGIVAVDSYSGLSSITFRPTGLVASKVTVFAPLVDGRELPRSALAGENDVFIALPEAGGAIALTVDNAVDASAVKLSIGKARASRAAQLLARYGGDARLAEIATAVEAAASWTAVATPAENNGLLMPVSRGWSRVPPLADYRSDEQDWSYAVFDWWLSCSELLFSLSLCLTRCKLIHRCKFIDVKKAIRTLPSS